MRVIFELVRKSILILLLVGVAGYAYYAYAVPCKTPVAYRLGNIDSRFGLSEAEALAVLQDAEAIWEKAAGEELFVYKADARLPVNFVYDQRQAVTDQNNDIKEDIEQTSQNADALKRAYDASAERYASARAHYLASENAYEQALKAYNERVAYWNARGGAPQKEYASMQAQKSALERQATSLEQERVDLNTLANQTNTLSAQYNALAKEVNTNVEVINRTAGREFEEGLYTKSAWSAQIDIYEFSDRAELVRVLAHELGHALGLEHNANADSIMYELNQSENSRPTAEDLASLRAVCGV